MAEWFRSNGMPWVEVIASFLRVKPGINTNAQFKVQLVIYNKPTARFYRLKLKLCVMKNQTINRVNKVVMFFVFSFLFTAGISAQHCGEATVPNNTEFNKLQDGMGFLGAYALPCIARGTYTEVQIPLKTFRLIKHLNGDDTVYQMRIVSISNLPEGMCWVTNKADNTFAAGEGGSLIVKGTTIDNTGQYSLNVVVSFDITGDGTFSRANENYNKVSKSGRMILRVNEPGTACERINYTIPGNIAGGPPASSAIQEQ